MKRRSSNNYLMNSIKKYSWLFIIMPLVLISIGYINRNLNREDSLYNNQSKLVFEKLNYNYYDSKITNNTIKVEKDNKKGIIGLDGSIIVAIEYDSVDYFYEGLAVVEKNGKWGFINKAGDIAIPFKYEFTFSPSGGLAVVKNLGNSGISIIRVIPLYQSSTKWHGHFPKG